MARYHFVRSTTAIPEGTQLPDERITVEYGKFATDNFGLFVDSEHFRDGKRYMIVGNCEGSLMVIDTARDVAANPLNKVHIGDLVMRRPHVESYEHHGILGFRADLFQYDTHYLKQELNELYRWRDPEYREELLRQYEARRKPDGELRWYCTPFRMKQLGISPAGLEAKIQELEAHLAWLRQEPQRETRRFVSDRTSWIEPRCYAMVVAMGQASTPLKLPSEKKKRGPKVIVNDDIFARSDLIETDLKAVLDFICPKVDLTRARNYWDEIATWEHL